MTAPAGRVVVIDPFIRDSPVTPDRERDPVWGIQGVFADPEWIDEYCEPDLALVPIDGHFTMDPEHAAFAMNEVLKP